MSRTKPPDSASRQGPGQTLTAGGDKTIRLAEEKSEAELRPAVQNGYTNGESSEILTGCRS
jgi:hypothetical protein